MPTRHVFTTVLLLTVVLQNQQLTTASAYWQAQRILQETGLQHWRTWRSQEALGDDYDPELDVFGLDGTAQALQQVAVCRAGSNTTTSCRPSCKVCDKVSKRCTCCKPGYIFSNTNKLICTPCPQGWRSHGGGFTRCIKCPDGRSTKTRAATKCDCKCGGV